MNVFVFFFKFSPRKLIVPKAFGKRAGGVPHTTSLYYSSEICADFSPKQQYNIAHSNRTAANFRVVVFPESILRTIVCILLVFHTWGVIFAIKWQKGKGAKAFLLNQFRRLQNRLSTSQISFISGFKCALGILIQARLNQSKEHKKFVLKVPGFQRDHNWGTFKGCFFSYFLLCIITNKIA